MAAGILLVDKATGMTSHDVVARARRALGTRKVGHAGTLDPMATGLLVLGVGSATRLLHYVVGLDKEYLGTIVLGQGSSTDDAEGELFALADANRLAEVTENGIRDAITHLTGDIMQVPASVSAINIDGQRAYARVRAGETIELPARPVRVAVFELLATRRSDRRIELDVRVECSPGTYIRALARDVGTALGVGGHLSALRRTRIGGYRVDDALPVEDLSERAASGIIPPAVAARSAMPTVEVSAEQAIDLRHGKRIARDGSDSVDVAAAIDPTGTLIAIVEHRADTWKVATGFPPDDGEVND